MDFHIDCIALGKQSEIIHNVVLSGTKFVIVQLKLQSQCVLL